MRLWTIQSERLFDRLVQEEVICCEPERSKLLMEGFGPAYDWMSAQMASRIGPPPEGVQYPIWAWHTQDWKHCKPNLRLSEFRGYTEPQVCLEIEIPDQEVLLSDEELWHIVLHDGYCADARSELEYQTEERWFACLPSEEQTSVKKRSWEKIFDVFPPLDAKWGRHGRYIQATFWELRIEQVRVVRHFAKRAAPKPPQENGQ